MDSLDFLQHGGRIGKTAALAGTILNIKPIITMKEGELFPESKIRGYKKALKTILEMTKKEIADAKADYRLCVIRAEKEKQEAAMEFVKELQADGYDVENEVWSVGITIGTHTGPTAIGICYMKKYEKVLS